jgi:hypothetical protein
VKLNNKLDPEVFIIYLEDIRIRLEMMNLMMTDKPFIVHILNNLMSKYDHQVETLEKRLGSSKFNQPCNH